MNITTLLEEKRAVIIKDAQAALQRVEMEHYTQASNEQRRAYLEKLLDLIIRAIQKRDLAAIVKYAETIATERYQAGYSLLEVQTGFNVLEEAIWRQVTEHVPPGDLAQAIGLISTAHGAGKDALARRYVQLAGETKDPQLNLSALFRGTDGV